MPGLADPRTGFEVAQDLVFTQSFLQAPETGRSTPAAREQPTPALEGFFVDDSGGVWMRMDTLWKPLGTDTVLSRGERPGVRLLLPGCWEQAWCCRVRLSGLPSYSDPPGD